MDANAVLKAVVLSLSGHSLFIKVINRKFKRYKQILILIIYYVIFMSLNLLLLDLVMEPFKGFITMVIVSAVLFRIIDQKFYRTIILTMISFSMSYLLFLCSALLSSVVFALFFEIHGKDNRLMIIGSVINLVFLVLFNKMKINFSYILDRGISGICVFITGIIFVFYGMSRDEALSPYGFFLVLTGLSLSVFGIFVWFKREKKLLFNQTVKALIIKDKSAQLNDLLHTHDHLSATAHKNGKILSAILNTVEFLAKKSKEKKVKEKAIQMLSEVIAFKTDYANEAVKLTDCNTFPTTGLALLDSVFIYMAELAKQKGIQFTLLIGETVNEITSFISIGHLATVASDLIENAIIAVNLNNSSTKIIEISIQQENEVFVLQVKDSGIQFEIDTLINLGKKRITTHSDTGGQGIGFMSVFEILHATGASLQICEYDPDSCEFRKAVAVRFDGKEEYIIQSSRIAEINARVNKDSNHTITPKIAKNDKDDPYVK